MYAITRLDPTPAFHVVVRLANKLVPAHVIENGKCGKHLSKHKDGERITIMVSMAPSQSFPGPSTYKR